MKYVIVIDTYKKSVTTYPEKPYFLRTGSETAEELAFRRAERLRYENTTLPDWLWDGVKELSKNL